MFSHLKQCNHFLPFAVIALASITAAVLGVLGVVLFRCPRLLRQWNRLRQEQSTCTEMSFMRHPQPEDIPEHPEDISEHPQDISEHAVDIAEHPQDISEHPQDIHEELVEEPALVTPSHQYNLRSTSKL